MKDIIKVGLRQRRNTTMWWSIALTIYIALTITTYPALRDQANQLNQAVANLPKVTKSLLTDSNDFVSPAGFLNGKLLYLILPMLFTFLAISLGSSLLAREERSGTLELLLARPVSRTKILLAKAAVGLSVMTTVTLVSVVVTVGLAIVVDFGLSSGAIALGVIMSAVMGMLFGAVAFMLSALGQHSRRMSTGIPAFLALASYLVVSLQDIAQWLKWPAYVLPYRYYHPSHILAGNYGFVNLAGFLVIIGVLVGIAIVGFRRRDIGS